MQKNVKLTVKESAATNSDFYNLFRPIAPSIDTIGKVAQVISGLTEAVTIWYITQSEMTDVSKTLSVLISIVAMVLVVAILELGGRKFLQVLTRALVWKRLKNAWYIGLFTIVAVITLGMGILSFNLSTNGVEHAFVSNVPVVVTFDDAALKMNYRTELKSINQHFNDELQLLQSNHRDMMNRTTEQFVARIQAKEQKIAHYDRLFSSGEKWAKSQADKQRKQRNELQTEQSNTLLTMQNRHSQIQQDWQVRKNKAIETEKTSLAVAITKGEKAESLIHQSHFQKASFWGNLFSIFVGFSVILAFICIISVELFRRGSGIQVEYHEEDQDIPVWALFWQGFKARWNRFFRSRAERFAAVAETIKAKPTNIGFGYQRPALSNQSELELPVNQHEEAL